MDKEKVIIGIKKAEARASDIVAGAQRQRNALIEQASSDSIRIEQEEVAKHKKMLEGRDAKAIEEIGQKSAEFRKLAERETAAIMKKQANLGKAVSHISDEFGRLIRQRFGDKR